MRREYVGGAQSARLTANLGGTTSDLTISCNDLSNWPTGVGSKPFYVVIDRGTVSEEKILCSSRSGNTLTVYNVGGNNGRGADDTSITAHSSNAVIEHVFTATDADEANAHVNDTTTDVHPQYLLESALTTKGDLISRSSTAVVRVPVGANGRVLTADSAETAGVKWSALPDPSPYAMSAARLTVTGISRPVGDGIATLGTINWPSGRFSQPPVVVLTSNENGLTNGSYKPIFTADTSASTCTIYLANANASTTITVVSLNAIAVQMTAGSATG